MKRFFLFISALTIVTTGFAAEASDWPAPYHPFKGEYSLYSGELGDQQAPTRDEPKVSFIIEGNSAKELFDAMGPDNKTTCGGEQGMRSRSKGHVWCTFQRSDGYTCYFGFNLKTGKSIAGGIC